MSIVSEITAVLGLVTKAKQLADELKNLELKGLIVDLQGKLLDVKEEVVRLREENTRLTEQVKGAPVAALPPKEAVTVKDGLYYKGDDGPFCTACYDTNEKLIRVADANHNEVRMLGYRRKCPVCKATYTK